MIPFAIAGLASGLRVIGVLTTCQQMNDAAWLRPDMKNIEAGVMADERDGAFWPSQGGLSRHLKYIARARIPEFESHHLSQAVWSPGRKICD